MQARICFSLLLLLTAIKFGKFKLVFHNLLLTETRTAKMSNLARYEANIPDRIGVFNFKILTRKGAYMKYVTETGLKF